MKKLTSISMMMLIMIHVIDAQVQIKPNMIKINPFGAFASAIPMNYERMFFDNTFSIVAGGAIISNKSGSGQSTYNNNGFAITPEMRYYFYNDEKFPARIYAGSYFNYEEHTNMSLDRLGEEVNGYVFGRGGGLLFGNQWFFQNGFVVDFYVGPGYMKYEVTEEYDMNVQKGGFLTSLIGPKNTGTKVKFGFSLGISF
jgi:hypothetical protein